MDDIAWDDLRIFFHVARSGGLSGAARQTGLSPATIGRRMLALEQRAGRALFERAQTGYSLTRAGQALMQRVSAMQAAAAPVQYFLAGQAAVPDIRLSAGTATTMFLVDRISALIRPGDEFRLNFVTTEAVLDISHREIDLGIRNRPPEAGNLASRPLGTLRFAPYRSWSVAAPELLEWVAMDPEHARHPAAHWLHQQQVPVRVIASSVATVHALVQAGAGIGVMPCLIGDSDPQLTRAGPVIEELTETQHLVMHADDRHRPALRRVIARLADLYRANADLLAGERPLRG